MSEKLTSRQVKSIRKMLANKGRRQLLKERKSSRSPEQHSRSRSPRRNDWAEDDEDYVTSEKIRRAEKIKQSDRPLVVAAPTPEPEPEPELQEVD